MNFWDRITLKNRAKAVLKNTYWMTFLALLIVAALGGYSGNSGSGVSLSSGAGASLGGVTSQALAVNLIMLAPVILLVLFVVFVFVAGYGIFVGSPMEVGKCRYLTMCRYGEVDLGQLFFAFRGGYYWNMVKTIFLRNLYTFLWSLLFVIPGIVKAYEYWMIPYILAENPNISKARAFELSKAVTRGEKWDIFVLDLSFIGWYILGAIAGCGIGVVFVYPYVEATKAELYGALRYKAVMTGLCGPDEIGRELFA
ncbi:MAG: DUF975 family protein [Oscillospiraceae bacterium]|nr:DUF975 family protein [Oscillospiraceae bacterium]